MSIVQLDQLHLLSSDGFVHFQKEVLSFCKVRLPLAKSILILFQDATSIYFSACSVLHRCFHRFSHYGC